MDPATLASMVTSVVMPYLTKVGENIAQTAGKKLWDVITDKFKDKPAASGAATEFAEKVDDDDNKEAFILQLKKAFKEDSDFAKEITDLLEKSSGGGITNTDGAVATNGSIAVGDLSISGDVTGNIVVGSGNSINQSSSTEQKKSQNNKNDLTE